ncbi:pleckstrin homology domain-containing family B member 1 isoform X2 [Denticeps clupeoides]|uniref:pleckstrin homology domain-containing family B member 1 isoform X2 n=1 Tax=Denticeps clupeoides TaxID=299321 RepID=UPI0010A30FC6|nr:pleckstrin homology domain-containing family B member 1-like isoform X2 [Denticeps clupeoides]
MALMKSGWLWRQSSILKRWKLNWCDLWIDGSLVFYKSESRKDYENRESCTLSGVCPPEGHPRENLVVVCLKDGSNVILCANSEDEALAWKLTMLEAKRNPVFTYNPYDDTYQSVGLDSHNAIYINPGSAGTHHIWIHREPYDDGIGEQVALGLLAGMAAGAALRSFLWMPFWFC